MACKTCSFFNEAKSQCRRNAPTPSSGAGANAAHWPTVAADDWCGEFKDKDAAKAA